jgi:hypothetical protein
LIIASLLMKYKEILQSLSWCTHQHLNHSKWTKNEENMGLKLERALQLCFQKKLRQTITHPLQCFLHWSFYLWHSKNFWRSRIWESNDTKKLLTLVNEWEMFSALVLVYFWHSKNFCSPRIWESQWHKNCSLWLRNERNIGNCAMVIRTCLVMSDSTLCKSQPLQKELKQ